MVKQKRKPQRIETEWKGPPELRDTGMASQTPGEIAESAEVKRQESFNGICSVLTPLNGNERQWVLKLVCMHFNISVSSDC